MLMDILSHFLPKVLRGAEWLVEIPVSVSWADLDGADQVEISKFDVMAQFDFYMQVLNPKSISLGDILLSKITF